MCFRSDVVMRHWKGGAPLPVGQCAGCFLEIWHFFVLAVLICGDVALPHQSRWAVAVDRHCIVFVTVLVEVKEEVEGTFRSPSCNPLLLFLLFHCPSLHLGFDTANFKIQFLLARRSRLFCSPVSPRDRRLLEYGLVVTVLSSLYSLV